MPGLTWSQRIRVLFGQPVDKLTAAPFVLPAPDKNMLVHAADVIDYVCKVEGCRYERWREGIVVYVALIYPDTTRIVGSGNSTLAAVHSAAKRAGVQL